MPTLDLDLSQLQPDSSLIDLSGLVAPFNSKEIDILSVGGE